MNKDQTFRELNSEISFVLVILFVIGLFVLEILFIKDLQNKSTGLPGISCFVPGDTVIADDNKKTVIYQFDPLDYDYITKDSNGVYGHYSKDELKPFE